MIMILNLSFNIDAAVYVCARVLVYEMFSNTL